MSVEVVSCEMIREGIYESKEWFTKINMSKSMYKLVPIMFLQLRSK